mmetsp:Transcript_21433/g.60437  ORF Transcript_21433/g.60437 Transcript_21433/m.60437 type:complete len:214 (+) Transcript_21433:2703-3344(+)
MKSSSTGSVAGPTSPVSTKRHSSRSASLQSGRAHKRALSAVSSLLRHPRSATADAARTTALRTAATRLWTFSSSFSFVGALGGSRAGVLSDAMARPALWKRRSDPMARHMAPNRAATGLKGANAILPCRSSSRISASCPRLNPRSLIVSSASMSTSRSSNKWAAMPGPRRSLPQSFQTWTCLRISAWKSGFAAARRPSAFLSSSAIAFVPIAS